MQYAMEHSARWLLNSYTQIYISFNRHISLEKQDCNCVYIHSGLSTSQYCITAISFRSVFGVAACRNDRTVPAYRGNNNCILQYMECNLWAYNTVHIQYIDLCISEYMYSCITVHIRHKYVRIRMCVWVCTHVHIAYFITVPSGRIAPLTGTDTFNFQIWPYMLWA
jgi:hypothetical protein